MKKLFTVGILIAALLMSSAAFGVSRNEFIAMGKLNDSLTVATSAVNDTSTTISPGDYSYIAAIVDVDRLGAGASGAGYFYFEGCVSDTSHTWIRIGAIADLSDSLEVKTQIAMSGNADISYGALLTVSPGPLVKGVWARVGPIETGAVNNWLPFKKIRMVIVDTNWNIWAKVKAYWVVRK